MLPPSSQTTMVSPRSSTATSTSVTSEPPDTTVTGPQTGPLGAAPGTLEAAGVAIATLQERRPTSAITPAAPRSRAIAMLPTPHACRGPAHHSYAFGEPSLP